MPVPLTVIADRYAVGELIGRGGMADVYAGTDRRLDRPVAIKLLSPEMAARPDIRVRFEAEARAAASLSHPNAVAVFDTGEAGDVPYIVMERLPGETLADRIAAGPLEPDVVTSLAGEVLSALGAAHAAGLVHRDVKPANILIAADGRAKVADFGIAKSVEARADAPDLTGTGQLLGTPAYLAPERINGAPATAQSDIYALGVVLYEALSGVKPFDSMTPLATAQAIASGAYRPLGEARPGLDPALLALVERAMATDPARRFRSAAEMASALGRASPPDATEVLESPTAPLAAPVLTAMAPDRRRRIAAAALAAAAVVALFLLLRAADSGTNSQPAASAPPSVVRTTAPPTTAAPSPTRQLAQKLRDAAGSFSASDGSFASQVAARLSQIADSVEAGNGGAAATALLTVLPVWNRTGLLSDSATNSVVALLKQVPGVDLTAYSAVTQAPAPTQKGKGKKGD